MMMKKKIFLFVLALMLFVALSLVGAFYFKFPFEVWDRLLPVTGGETRYVILDSGINARQSAQAFFEQGALEGSVNELARWMVRFGIDRKIRPGQYEVKKADAWNLARQLRNVRPVVDSITIIPGADVYLLRTLFSKAENPEGKDGRDLFSTAILDNSNYPEAMLNYLPATEEGRVAFLYPETYFVVKKTPEALIRLASSAWWEQFQGTLSADITSGDLHGIAIKASMIEREALWDAERARIAGVIKNRLKKEMLLQIDATVVYAWKVKGKNLTRVLHGDLSIDSPYNTYIKPGLPPEPICIPSLPSWQAALNPEAHQYYYYVARKDGHHYFSKNYDEHLRNVKKARQE